MFVDPKGAWTSIKSKEQSFQGVLVAHTAIFALIPAVAGYYGTTVVGWQVGGGAVTRLAPGSALQICVLYYLAMIVVVASVGGMIRWMSQTYGADQPLGHCIALATYTATPLFLVGLMQAYPVLWLNLVVGLPALGYTIFLFYTGVPIIMEIPPERAFLFSSAVLAFGLVAFVAMLAVTVLLWGSGIAPAFVQG
ncbi:MAG: YIP1 family protein [Ectothiorhodospiraceae bacterium]|nr:YIP1 family protein [Chromatiales bacterium]MCP5153779.1 YIP1 family protein [Ectothiorhodospiraceae bacterium]